MKNAPVTREHREQAAAELGVHPRFADPANCTCSEHMRVTTKAQTIANDQELSRLVGAECSCESYYGVVCRRCRVLADREAP